MTARVSVNLNPDTAWCQGRNGLVKIKELTVWETGGGEVIFDGINKRGIAINGGFGITVEAMDELAKKWLEARGKEGNMEKKVYIHVSGGVVDEVYGPSGFKAVIIDEDNGEADEDTEAENKELQAELEDMKVAGVVVALDQN